MRKMDSSVAIDIPSFRFLFPAHRQIFLESMAFKWKKTSEMKVEQKALRDLHKINESLNK